MVKEPNKSRVNAGIRTEQETGRRLCVQCDKMLSLDQFETKKRRFLCIEHFRAMKLHNTLGTHEKRAFNSIRCRARADMLLFGMDHMVLPMTLVLAMLTEDQLAEFSKFCIIPCRPDRPLSKENSIVVTSIQRIYVVSKWRSARDPDQYERDLNHMLSEK
jgi:hypothetical protein